MATYNVTDTTWAGGAKGNGVMNADGTITLGTDDTAAVQAAITAAANAGGGTVYFPPGIYCFLHGSAPLNVDSTLSTRRFNDITFQGVGTSGTILVFEEGTVSAIGTGFHPLFIGTYDRGIDTDGKTRLYKGAVEFYDMTIRGRMFEVLQGVSGLTSQINVGAPAFYMQNFRSVTISRCRLFGMCNFGSVFEAIGRANVIGNEFELICRDMCRFRSTFTGTVTGNTFRHSDDDAVAFHQYSVFSTSPGEIREGLIVSNNQFEDVLGVHVLGARKALISSNVFRRCKVAAVAVAFNQQEGENPIFGVSIVDNHIFDMIERPQLVGGTYTLVSDTQIGVYITSALPKSGTTPVNSNGALPGGPSSSGVFASEFPYYDSINSTTSTDAFPGASQLNISRNTICRTLPARTASTTPAGTYSSWGMGKCFAGGSYAGVVGWIDPTVPETSMNPYSLIGFPANARNVTICDNVLSDAGDAINLDGSVNIASATSLQVLISRNSIRRVSGSGIILQAANSGAYCFVDISDNIIDGDPWHKSPNRNANGTWTNLQGSPVGVKGNLNGAWVKRNTFRNVSEPLQSTLYSVSAQDNILEGFWVQVGYSASNQGIGFIPAGGPEWLFRWIKSDPTASGYGQIVSPCLQSSSSMPTSGYYVQGALVRNSNPYAGSGQYVFGWVRRTTGNSHVMGTDWFSVALGTT